MPYRSIPDDEVSVEVLAARKDNRATKAILDGIPNLLYHDQGDAGIRWIRGVLDCGHRIDVSSEMGGYDEGYGVPSMQTLACHLEWRANMHDCEQEERLLARRRGMGLPF